MRAAIVSGDASAIAATLVGGRAPHKRLAIHARHFEASLATALVGRFPALVWLTGSSFVTEAARAFVHRHPPTAPCIAEYGDDFPAFLAQRPGAERLPFLTWAGALEWRLAEVALAIDRPPLALAALRAIDAPTLADTNLRLQPGLRYLSAPWPVDDLMKLFLADTAPERYELALADVHLEIRGARGTFTMTRLDIAALTFRRALAQGDTIGTAAELALDADAAFAPGAALTNLFAEELVIEAVPPQRNSAP
jgi:hypothetical protein